MGAAFPLEGVLDTLAAAMPGDPISQARFVRQVLLDPNYRDGGSVVAREGDEVAGYCLALARQVPLENAPSDAGRGYVTLIAVRPEHRRRGIGSRMLERAEAYLREQGRQEAWVSPYAPGYFVPGVDAASEDALGFFACHGYAEVYRPLAMEAPLWSLQVPAWVRDREGERTVRYLPYTPELTLPLLRFAQEHFPGDWVRVVRETMGQIVTGENPARLFVAVQDGEVLGFSHFENERFGPIGVAPPARGRGIGQVLMFRTLQAQREAGFRAAWFLWSDDRTADRLYRGAGFSEVRRFVVLRKEL